MNYTNSRTQSAARADARDGPSRHLDAGHA